ncbi:hypothetical protein CCUS01_06704, partial [Colletotrichum cuscutae]
SFTSTTAALYKLLNKNLNSYTGLLYIYKLLIFYNKLLLRRVRVFITTYLNFENNIYDFNKAYDILES